MFGKVRFEGAMEECWLVNCRNPMVNSYSPKIQNSSSPAPFYASYIL